MNLAKRLLLASATSLMAVAGAQAVDLPTKKAPPPVAAPNCFATFMTWLDSTSGDCPLSYGPVTFYGQIDVGGGYQTNGAPFNKYYNNGVENLIGKQSNGAKWQFVPNGLSQTNLGLKFRQKVWGDINLIGDINFSYDPYSLQFANGPASLQSQNAVPAYYQQSNSDGSRAGALWNSRAYLGLASPTYGTFTAGRIYSLSNTLSSAYDPMGGAYAFGLIGYSSSSVAGLGVSGEARYNTGASYVYDYKGLVHIGGAAQVGGYEQLNNSNGAYEIDVGGNYAGFSLDGLYSYAKDALSLGAWGGNSGAFGLPKGIEPYELKATLANVSAFTMLAKYNWQQLTLYGGYASENFGNPSDTYAWGIGETPGGFSVAPNSINSGSVTYNAYNIHRIQQIAWTGAKYAILPNLDATVAYYEIFQNDYNTTACGVNTTPVSGAPKGTPPQGASSSKCAGNEPVVGFMLDYRPWKRVDTYAGVTWSEVTGGLANGYIQTQTTALTAGVRVSF